MHQFIKTLYLQIREKEYSAQERADLVSYLKEEIPKSLHQYQETQHPSDLKELLRLQVFYQVLMEQCDSGYEPGEVCNEDRSFGNTSMGVSRAV